MTNRLWWVFGEPREEGGELAVNFYYQMGRHADLRIPLSGKRLKAAGEMPIEVYTGQERAVQPIHLSNSRVEIGKKLYQILGPDAQSALIRSFLSDTGEEGRILHLLFSPPPPGAAREWSLMLEDLPWEMLHDGERFIAERYNLQIIRSHCREPFPDPPGEVEISSWRVLLLTPFVFMEAEECRRRGLDPLPRAGEEARRLRGLETKTHGLVEFLPKAHNGDPGGIVRVSELGEALARADGKPFHAVHYTGHGVIYRDEPCLCFEDGNGGIDYVSVDRLADLFRRAGAEAKAPPPKVLFLHACSSSSRGRYSSGMASGLHELGMGVIGYHSEIEDNELPVAAAERFYRSLCLEQSLYRPYLPARVTAAVAAARERLAGGNPGGNTAWGNLRAYLPSDFRFRIKGRNRVERVMQSIYSHYAQWMNPTDYTDHLSIGIFFAFVFGVLLGTGNLFFIFPESVPSNYLSYNEIVSELVRIFLVGPISFLGAAVWAAAQTHRNHAFLSRAPDKIPWSRLLAHTARSAPWLLAAAASFCLLFSYSFSRLDLLTAQTKALATLPHLSAKSFWYGLLAILGIFMSGSLAAATLLGCRHRDTLHSYRTFYWLLPVYGASIVAFAGVLIAGNDTGMLFLCSWLFCLLVNIAAYSFAVTKIVKEAGMRSLRRRPAAVPLSWRKLAPLIGGAALTVFCYFLLEESVRFENQTIERALIQRYQTIGAAEGDIYVERVLERALRQRAILDVPDRVVDAAERDWLLSVIAADYKLFQARQAGDEEEYRRLLDECAEYLEIGRTLKPEVRFRDYYENIEAFALMLRAELLDSPEERIEVYRTVARRAESAVRSDPRNFAYLDTLARAELKLANLTGDRGMLEKAAGHLRKAEWSAFFLRSPRAREVRESIQSLLDRVTERLAQPPPG